MSGNVSTPWRDRAARAEEAVAVNLTVADTSLVVRSRTCLPSAVKALAG